MQHGKWNRGSLSVLNWANLSRPSRRAQLARRSNRQLSLSAVMPLELRVLPVSLFPSPRFDLPVGTGPQSVTAADLNSDGNVDLISANNVAPGVTVLLGNGDGTFAAAVNYAAGSNSFSVITADVNTDGNPDVIVANAATNSGSVSVLLGNGNGTLAAAVNLSVGAFPTVVVAVDVNNDGDLDLVAENSQSSSLSILIGNGNGTFAAATNFSLGSGRLSPSLANADFNEDGNVDLVCTSPGGTNLLLGNGNGTFQAPVVIAGTTLLGFTVADDFNQDGNVDLAGVLGTTGVAVLLGNGNGTFGAQTNTLWGNGITNNTSYLISADLNADGNPDLVTGNNDTNGTVSVLLGNSNGTFGTPQNYTNGINNSTNPLPVVAADVNRDSHLDLVSVNFGGNTLNVLLGDGNGGFGPARFLTGPGPDAMTVADVNGDTRPDVITANLLGSNVSVLLGNANGTFSAVSNFATGIAPGVVSAVDLNGDSRIDLITLNLSTDVSVLLGNGNGTFAAPTNFAAGNSPRTMVVRDVNGDGQADLIVANTPQLLSSSGISVLLGNGNGTFQAAQNIANTDTLAVDSLVAVDVNGDSQIDLVASSGSAMNVFLGSNNGSFGAATNFGTGNLVQAADLTGDGQPDLVAVTSGGANLFQGASNGTFGAATSISGLTATPRTLTLVDVNGDGRVDVLASIVNSNVVTLLLGNGNGTFQAAQNFLFGGQPQSLAAADISGDAHADLIVGNQGDSSVAVLLNLTGPPTITSVSSAVFTLGVAGSFTVTTAGLPAAALTVAGALPAGVTFTDNGDGTATIAGTPGPATGGSYALTITAQNGTTPNATQAFTLSVGQAPAITSGTSATFTAGTAGLFNITTTGFPIPTITETGALPAGVTFTNNGDGTATFSGTPAAGSGGIYRITVRADNGATRIATQSFTLTVNEALAITSPASAVLNSGVPGSFTITTAGFPVATITRTGTLPPGISFTDNGDGTATLAGTPSPTASGTYTLTISAQNGLAAVVTQTLSLTVGLAIPANVQHVTWRLVGNVFQLIDTDHGNLVLGSQSPSVPSVINPAAGSVVTLTLDLSDIVPGTTVTFNGGASGRHTMVVANRNFSQSQFVHQAAYSGSLRLGSSSDGLTVNYSGVALFDVSSVGSITSFTLPAGVDASLTPIGSGQLQLVSNGNAFESTEFGNPIQSLNVSVGGNGALRVAGLPSSLQTAAFTATANGTVFVTQPGTTAAQTFTAPNGSTGQTLYIDFTSTTGGALTTSSAVSGQWTVPGRASVSYVNFNQVVPIERLYRAYNPNTGFHFYTSAFGEFSIVTGSSVGLHDESTGQDGFAVVRSQVSGAVPILRLYNPNGGQHYYTVHSAEAAILEGLGWTDEGTAGFLFTTKQPGTTEIFHVYNKVSGEHIFTESTTYIAALQAQSPGAWVLQRSLGFGIAVPEADMPFTSSSQSVTSAPLIAAGGAATAVDTTGTSQNSSGGSLALAIAPAQSFSASAVAETAAATGADPTSDQLTPITSSSEAATPGLDEFWTSVSQSLGFGDGLV